MKKHLRFVRRFLRSEDGPTAVEYAVMLAMILLVCFGSIQLIGQETKDSWTQSSNKIEESFSDAGL